MQSFASCTREPTARPAQAKSLISERRIELSWAWPSMHLSQAGPGDLHPHWQVGLTGRKAYKKCQEMKTSNISGDLAVIHTVCCSVSKASPLCFRFVASLELLLARNQAMVPEELCQVARSTLAGETLNFLREPHIAGCQGPAKGRMRRLEEACSRQLINLSFLRASENLAFALNFGTSTGPSL